MKKIILFVLFLFIGMGLVSCDDNKMPPSDNEEVVDNNKLLAPENLRYSDGVLKWSIVDNASGYVVVVDLDEYSVSDNSFNLSQINLSNGNHNAKVRCVGNDKYLSSDYTPIIIFDYQKISQEIPDDKDINTDVFDNYHSSKKINAYVGEDKKELKISNSINLDDTYYMWYFDLGTIRRTPIYCSYAMEYQFDCNMKFSFDKLTSKSLSNATTAAVEKINTHSVNAGFSLGFEEGVDLGYGIGGSKWEISFKTSQSFNTSWTDNWGSIETNSESTTDTYLRQYSEGFEIELPFSTVNGFKKGNFYRVSFYETLSVYGVVVYNTSTKEYTIAYQTFFDNNSKICVIEESENEKFAYPKQNVLSFDVDKAIEIAKNNVPENKSIEPERVESVYGDIVKFIMPSNTLLIDLSKYQENGNIENFSKYVNFKEGVLTIYSAIDYKDIYNVEIIGAYKQKDTNGKIIGDDQILKNFSIYFDDDWDRDISLTIKNLAFSSSTRSAISTNANLILNVIGENKILTTDANPNPVIFSGNLVIKGNGLSSLSVEAAHTNSGQKGADGFVSHNMDIEEITLNVSAGNGSDSSTGVGGAGGVALMLSGNLFINKGTKLNAVGGNGGRGANGLTSPTSKSIEYFARRGYDGGAGGAGINCNFILIDETTSSNISITGGAGGSGGNGGHCQSGGQWASSNLQNILAGGSGGNGGAGGNAIEYNKKNFDDKIMSIGHAKLIGGKGNVGGTKGNCDETNPLYKPSKKGYPTGYKDGDKGADGITIKQVEQKH